MRLALQHDFLRWSFILRVIPYLSKKISRWKSIQHISPYTLNLTIISSEILVLVNKLLFLKKRLLIILFLITFTPELTFLSFFVTFICRINQLLLSNAVSFLFLQTWLISSISLFLTLESSVIFWLISKFLAVSYPFSDTVNTGYHE